MLTLKMPRKMSFAKEQDSRFIITMNKIQYEVMHAVHERPHYGPERPHYGPRIPFVYPQ